MFKFHKLQIINSLLLFVLVVSAGYGQSKSINFLWEDKQKKESNGSLILEWQNDLVLNRWKLHINVVWYNARGETISDPETKPFIYLSEYDLEKKTDKVVKCLNFSVSNKIYDLQFQDSGELRFELPPETEKPGTLEIVFKYSLSWEDIALANIDPITIPNQKKVVITLPDTRVKAVEQVDNRNAEGKDSSRLDSDQNTDKNCFLVRRELTVLVSRLEEFSRLLGQEDGKIGLIRGEISAFEPSDTIQKNEIESKLQTSLNSATVILSKIDSIFPEIRRVSDILNGKIFPEDSAIRYQRKVDELNNDFRALRVEFVQSRGQIWTLFEELGSSFPDLILTNLKKNLEDKYINVFQEQLASIQDIQNSYSQIEPGLLEEIRKGPKKAQNNSVLEGFRQAHGQIKASLDSLNNNHKEDYFNYREGIEETGAINSLENLHLRFNDIYGNTGNSINIMDLEMSRLDVAINEQNIKPSMRNLIIGGSIFLFFVLLILLARRVRQNERKSQTSVRAGVTAKSADGGVFDLLEDNIEQPAEYYKMNVPLDHPDMMLTELHFHIRVIKSVYQLLQGALLAKDPENFGGLFFGRQYKAIGISIGRHILLVEKVVPASNIRTDMTPGNEGGVVLVEEIEKLIGENKKLALLGWFTSAIAKDLEMPDNLVKVHRTFFRDKWQIACLIHPVSDSLNSGVFIRRKSGFFDTIPTEEYQLKWDDLYQFAINPPLKSQLEEKKKPNTADYLKINLNENWCDSIVERVFLHPSVLLDISSEKSNREQLASGQMANGFFYGEAWTIKNDDQDQLAFEIFINKFAVASNSENPRDLPGFDLLGWLRFEASEIFESLKQAIPYHTEVFNSPYQLAVFVNTQTNELRFFSRKHSMEMNNNTIETEEFNLDSLIESAKSHKPSSENNITG